MSDSMDTVATVTVPAAGSSRGTASSAAPLTLVRLTARLTRARLAAREGEGLLYLASVLAHTVTTCAALSVAGGTWMLYSRGRHPERVPVWEAEAQTPAGTSTSPRASTSSCPFSPAPCWSRPW